MKQRTRHLLISAILLAFLSVLLTSCGGYDYEGKWYDYQGKQYTFSEGEINMKGEGKVGTYNEQDDCISVYIEKGMLSNGKAPDLYLKEVYDSDVLIDRPDTEQGYIYFFKDKKAAQKQQKKYKKLYGSKVITPDTPRLVSYSSVLDGDYSEKTVILEGIVSTFQDLQDSSYMFDMWFWNDYYERYDCVEEIFFSDSLHTDNLIDEVCMLMDGDMVWVTIEIDSDNSWSSIDIVDIEVKKHGDLDEYDFKPREIEIEEEEVYEDIEEAEDTSSERVVYISNTGTKYHAGGCRTLKSEIEISYEEAKRRGYTPCGVCNPAP